MWGFPWRLVLEIAFVAWAIFPNPAFSGETVEEEFLQPKSEYREGMQLMNVIGNFERAGDRLTFVLAGGQRFYVLENLNLERIVDKLDVDSGPLSWSVSGTITEYRGRYYLLISRARARRGTQQAIRPRLRRHGVPK